MCVSTNTWSEVKRALEKRDVPAYYMGGTLCLDYRKDSGIALNLNGKGFVYGKNSNQPHMKNTTLYQPDFIIELVRSIYISSKGKNDHYKDEVEWWE